MTHDDHGMQSFNHGEESHVLRGGAHDALLVYVLCATVIAMSCVALIVNAHQIEDAKSGIKHHP